MIPLKNINGRTFFCSWSGGKDSCLAYYDARQAGGQPAALFTMLAQDGSRSVSHALPPKLLQAQAAALGVPLAGGYASWETYEAQFHAQLQEFTAQGITIGVFGDIDLDGHREWEEQICARSAMDCCLPLWQQSRLSLVERLVSLEFVAVIVVVRLDRLPLRFLGQRITLELLEELASMGVDPCGEEGEYHSVVLDGPCFSHAIPFSAVGTHERDGYGFLDMDASIY